MSDLTRTRTPSQASSAAPKPGASALLFSAACLVTLVAAWSGLRLILCLRFLSAPPGGATLLAFIVGLGRDVLAGLWAVLPLVIWPLLAPPRRPLVRSLFWTFCLVYWFAQTFLIFAEYFFFDEFRSRFNTVAVDYLQYPTEVFVNIWDSYHVGLVLIVCAVPALLWVWAARKIFGPAWGRPVLTSVPARTLGLVGAAVLLLAPLGLIAGSLAGVLTSPLRLQAPHVSSERTLNQIADNGEFAFLSAALTHHLEYTAFYKTLPKDRAYQRARLLLGGPGVQFESPADSIRRSIAGDLSRPRLNVVILLEESFGAEFWGCLGRTNTLTPEMDRLAAQEGMLFTNLYASGNRTVRGMEGVLASFPPLPGESIVKREFSDNVDTVARVLKRDGYSTLFLYGGRGVFDGMRSFTVRNGFDRFIEQKNFEHPSFTTVWGVCDEDLYDRSIAEMRVLANSGKPFLTTILSVSNHKPFTYPKGKIDANPDEKKRENAVLYSDFALGEFFRKARKESFWTNTIFAVVADHGARVYGEQSIPIHSYEIPLLILGPAVVSGPVRIGELGCSLDVAPTLLGLVGRPYRTTFFGQDMLKCSADNGRALLNHNRDIGLLARQRLVVLGLMRGEEFYAATAPHAEMKPLRSPGPLERELQLDAMALYEVADDLYTHQLYRLDDDRSGVSAERRD
jgi:phosphoglycerol transferase MdoB-like AlkP superfamily enzyme